MLKTLYIKNYALISNLEIEFGSGFSVITGETGAGKSIILGALSLILGQRADVKSIKQGENKCIIEGFFDVSDYDLKNFCEETGIEYDSKTYTLRREILSTGKSRAFINDSPASLNDLKELGSQLIDIHSQHQNLILADTRFQFHVIDTLAGTGNLLKEYQKYYKEYNKTLSNLEKFRDQAEKSKKDEDYIRFQFDALSEANLRDGEQIELEKELNSLSHAEDIKSALFKIHTALSDDDKGVVTLLKDSLNTAQSIHEIYANSESIARRIETAYIDLRDLSSDTGKYAENIEFDPERFEYINNRLDQIYSLQQKYKVSGISELIDLRKDYERKLENIDSFDQHIEELEKEMNLKLDAMLSVAERLSLKRQSAVPDIETQLMQKVAGLGIPNIQFKCQLTRRDSPDLFGIDDLQFMFSANKNIPLQPISEVASGGETSRVMLSLKSMIAGATALPTIVFDEIDTGVSGEVAHKMGQIMQEFGKQMQVIAITHLPQIAAKGKAHYFVYKDDEGDTTTTNLRLLTQEERIHELAQMLSGSQITEAAIQNAKEILKQ